MESSELDLQQQNILRDDVRLLGNLLGKTIKQQQGEQLFNLVEEVRGIAKLARQGDAHQTQKLIEILSALKPFQLMNLARAFTLFLNLANIAEQHHQIRQRRKKSVESFTFLDSDKVDHSTPHPGGFLELEINNLIAKDIPKSDILTHFAISISS